MTAPTGNLASLAQELNRTDSFIGKPPQGETTQDAHNAVGGADPTMRTSDPSSGPQQAAPQAQQLTITVFTSEKPTILTKTFVLQEDGTVKKETSAHMSAGIAETESFNTMEEFANFLPTLGANQAVTYGIPKCGISPVKVVTSGEKAKYLLDNHVIARTTESLVWNAGPGVLMLDYDPSKGADEPLTPDALLAALVKAAPGLMQATVVWWMSASSNIYDGDKLVKGVGGQRVYIGVQNAIDIPRAGKALADRLWLDGHGYFEVSKSCALLERTLVDTSVWQTNRFDFAAGAKCAPPLNQRRGKPVVHHLPGWIGDLLDSYTAIPELDGLECHKLESLKAAERAKLKPEIEKAADDFITEQVSKLAKKHPDKPEDELRKTVKHAIGDHKLMGDFEVKLDDGTMVPVAHLLDNREKYHRRKTYDPLEADYDGGRVVGILYLDGGRPNLWSQAHGGRSFKLIRATRRIEVVGGETAALVDNVCDRLRSASDVFDFGDAIATVSDGRVRVENESSLFYYLGSEHQFWKARPTEKNPKATVNVDPPLQMIKVLLALQSARGLRKLTGVITAPTMRPDYSILDRPGYDVATKLFYQPKGDAPRVPLNPTVDQLNAAIQYLWQPFHKFPFVAAADRGALFSVLLTAAVRAGIGPAPAHAFDAPSYGSGKTLLAKCASVVAGGICGKVSSPPPPSEDEIRKRILSMLVDGDAAVIWDNLTWPLGSQSLASLLTADYYTDRKLGVTENKTFPSRLLMLLTGNQLEIMKDMMRRVVTCRINAYEENAGRRAFTFDPLQMCVENRTEMVVAALTIIRYWYVNKKTCGEHNQSRTASFEQWDDLVRQPICWMARMQPNWIADPMSNVEKAQEDDPARFDRYTLLTGLRELFGEQWFQAGDFADYYVMEKMPLYEKVKTALVSLAPRKSAEAPFTAQFVGTELRKHRDHVIEGIMLITERDARTKAAKWRIAVVARDTPEATDAK